MSPDTLILLEADLALDEGKSAFLYRDTKGIQTIGIGHNCEASPLPADWTPPLTDDQINLLFTQDIQEVFDLLDADLSWWRTVSETAQRVLANLGFNMGVPKLCTFITFLGLVQAQNYVAAANDLQGTAWYGQVGQRGPRMVARLKGA